VGKKEAFGIDPSKGLFLAELTTLGRFCVGSRLCLRRASGPLSILPLQVPLRAPREHSERVSDLSRDICCTLSQ
jgi:hypothetical protein